MESLAYINSPNLTSAGAARPYGLHCIQHQLGTSWMSSWNKGIFFPLHPVASAGSMELLGSLSDLYSCQRSELAHVRLPGLGSSIEYSEGGLLQSHPLQSTPFCPSPTQKRSLPTSKTSSSPNPCQRLEIQIQHWWSSAGHSASSANS